MNKQKDNRFENNKQPARIQGNPAAPTSSTADNASVQNEPAIQKQTKDHPVLKEQHETIKNSR